MKTFFKFLLQYSSFKYILEASVKALEQFGKEYRSMKTITNCNHNQRIEKPTEKTICNEYFFCNKKSRENIEIQ